MATIHARAAKMRRRLAADVWPWVARHSLVTSTSAGGLLSDMFRSPISRLLHDGRRAGSLTCYVETSKLVELITPLESWLGPRYVEFCADLRVRGFDMAWYLRKSLKVGP